jgi:transcriptional regulator with XRE-family HTH domain
MVDRGPDAASLGRLVREQRARLRLTQSELASRVGVSRSAISELEAGRIEQPRASVFARLAAALGLPAAALLAAAGYPATEVLLELETDELAVLAASLARIAGNEREWLKTRLLELRDLLVLRAGGPKSRGRRASAASAARTRGGRRGRRAPGR